MITYDDSEIDAILWSEIEHSESAGDFAAYLKHKPEGAIHIDSAKKRFKVLSNGPTSEAPTFRSAIERIRLLAKAGNPTALFHMGKFYGNGTGVAKDEIEATRWYEQAVQAGELRAHCNLGLMYRRGDGVEQDNAKALELLRKAALGGESLASAYVGVMTFCGEGCEADHHLATEMLESAFESGVYWVPEI